MRPYLVLFILSFLYFSLPVKAEFPDANVSTVPANFIPENIVFGANSLPLDPQAACEAIWLNGGGLLTTSVHPDTYYGGSGVNSSTAVVNSTHIRLYCNGTYIDSYGETRTATRLGNTLTLTGSHECPSVHSSDHTIQGVAPYFSDKHCYKPLKCEVPFEAEGIFDGSGKLIVAQCKTYCPHGSNFNYDLGRCDIAKDEAPQCEAQQHNPIDTSTGEKRQLFTDFTQRTSLPLSFTRSYAHYVRPKVRINENKKLIGHIKTLMSKHHGIQHLKLAITKAPLQGNKAMFNGVIITRCR